MWHLQIALTDHEGSSSIGQVIEAFGNSSSQELQSHFVFVILEIINLVVITKGAGRVAKFQRDLLLTQCLERNGNRRRPKRRRPQTTKPRNCRVNSSQSFGAMDGASKFVKGDAIAGILILVSISSEA